jgi:site-specific DNA-methyltransferase (adenine-specific)
MDQRTFELMRSSESHEWYTPLPLYQKLNEEFHFTTDPCSDPTNRLGCEIFYTKEDDGLSKPWYGNVFINSPYGKETIKWIRRANIHASVGAGTVVTLIPARTDTTLWFDYIWDDKKHKPRKGVEIRFIKGRLKFDSPDNKKLNTAPFPSAIIVFSNKSRSK